MKKISLDNKVILVTGSSGFIGSYLCDRLLKEYKSIKIIGLDNMNNYYDIRLKLKPHLDKDLEINRPKYKKNIVQQNSSKNKKGKGIPFMIYS